MRYAIVPFAPLPDPAAFRQRVEEIDKGAYTQYHPTIYFLSFSGTPTALAQRLGVHPVDNAPAKRRSS